ncbi:unnamed protein product [Mortierella alpina]
MAMRQVLPSLFLVIALVLSGTEGSPRDSCKDLAEFVQKSNSLPTVPDEHGQVIDVTGSQAKKMFPGQAANLSIFKKYTFVAYFKKCVPQPMYTQLQVKSGRYFQNNTSKLSLNLELELGFDLKLLNIFRSLPKVKAAAGIARGVEKVTVARTSIKEGEIKQECVVAPGWRCIADIKLHGKNDGKSIVDENTMDPAFFPASINGKNLYSIVWLDLPKDSL